MLPSRIGHYEITGVLGSGGMSIVYRAIQPSLNRVVALKVLAPMLEHDPVAVERFRQEATSAARLKHPNIVTIYEANVSAPPHYIAMEFLDGGSLADRLARGPLPLGDAIRIGGQIALGLDHAHRRGVVHRDVKPSNVMFDSDGKTAVTDFGISRVLDQTKFTVPGAKLGTPDYMSPEQARGQEADHRSDLYSLAVVVYEMLTGRTPFRSPEPLVTMRQIVEDPVPSARAINPSLPSGVDGVLLKALAKDPRQRYQNCTAFWRELIAVSQGTAVRPRARHRRRALVGVLIGVAVGLATLLGALLLADRRQTPVSPRAGGGVEGRPAGQRSQTGGRRESAPGDRDSGAALGSGPPIREGEAQRFIPGRQPDTPGPRAPVGPPPGQVARPGARAAGNAMQDAAVGRGGADDPGRRPSPAADAPSRRAHAGTRRRQTLNRQAGGAERSTRRQSSSNLKQP